MPGWVMVVWDGWLPVSWTPWPLSLSRPTAMAFAMNMASSHRPYLMDTRLVVARDM